MKLQAKSRACNFGPFQKETIAAILEGRDAFVAVPIGKLKKKEKKLSCHT